VAAAGIAVYGNCPPDADRTRLVRRSKARQISRLGNAIMSCHAISTPSALTTIINSKLYADQHVIRCKNTYRPSDAFGSHRRRQRCLYFYPQTGPALGTRRTNPTTTVRQCSIHLASERTSNMDACGCLLLHGRVAIRSIIKSVHSQAKHDRHINAFPLIPLVCVGIFGTSKFPCMYGGRIRDSASDICACPSFIVRLETREVVKVIP
jgi:hypothetical protein